MTTLRTNDAQNRTVRTLLQGAAWDVAIAIAAALLVWLPDAELSSRDAWIVLGTAVAKTVLTAIASFVMRAKLDASRLPTPLPPSDPGEPDDDVHTDEQPTYQPKIPPTIEQPGGMRARTDYSDGDPHRPH